MQPKTPWTFRPHRPLRGPSEDGPLNYTSEVIASYLVYNYTIPT